MPSTNDSRQPYRLSNLDLVTESLTLMAGTRDAAPVLDDVVPVLRIFSEDLLQQVLDDLFFVAAGGAVNPLIAIFQLIALVNQQGDIATVIDHHLGTLAAFEIERLIGAPPVLFEALALPGEDRDAGGRDGCGGMILRREYVAAGPAHLGAKMYKRLNEHPSLNGHVQRAGDADAGQRLGSSVLIADRDQAWHLVLGDGEFLAAPVGQRHVCDFVVLGCDFEC
jgi:hypothetical protein